MDILSKLIRLLLISIVIFLLAYCFRTKFAHAEGNSFASRTLILTPDGKIPIEELYSDDLANEILRDRVMGYNFVTHQTEVYTVNEIKPISSLSYYVINNQTKIAGTNFVYISTPDNLQIIKAYQLRTGDKLIGQSGSNIVVRILIT
ncbi:MAG: hypothetical protein AB4372_38175 [Xenococcus sp. (in: cyanobacteria)]